MIPTHGATTPAFAPSDQPRCLRLLLARQFTLLLHTIHPEGSTSTEVRINRYPWHTVASHLTFSPPSAPALNNFSKPQSAGWSDKSAKSNIGIQRLTALLVRLSSSCAWWIPDGDSSGAETAHRHKIRKGLQPFTQLRCLQGWHTAAERPERRHFSPAARATSASSNNNAPAPPPIAPTPAHE
jgi:hypothetical protein